MPELSTADHSQNPLVLQIPRRYNAAYDLIERNLRAGFGAKTAYIDDQRRLTYAELDQRSAAFANALLALGVQREGSPHAGAEDRDTSARSWFVNHH